MDNINIITINVRGLNNQLKRKKLSAWLNDNNFHIAFLQETYCVNHNVAYINKDLNGHVYHCTTTSSHSKGVLIWINNMLEHTIVNKAVSDDGRMVLLNINIQDTIYSLMSVYAPNVETDRCQFFKSVEIFIEQNAISTDNFICAGDMNCCLYDRDRSVNTHINDKSRKILHNILQMYNITDLWSMKDNGDVGFTYIDRKNGTKSRLDYILIGKYLKSNVQRIRNREISFIPDHLAVSANISLNISRRGPGYWKLNAQLLKEDAFKECVRKEILLVENEFSNCHMSKKVFWEILKIRIRDVCIKYSTNRIHNRKKRKRELQDYIDEINQQLMNGVSVDNDLLERKEKYKELLDDMYEEECKGSQIRSKVQWIEQGEKCTKFFLQLEKKRQANNVIYEVIDDSGNIVNDNLEVLKIITGYYDNLYKSENISDNSIDLYLKQVASPKLSSKQRDECDKELSYEELYDVISKLKTGKSPGTDGLTPEFYQCFYEDIKSHLMSMLEECYVSGELCDTMKQALITLIHKGGDTAEVKNYRPISLTNYDYKILAFIMSSRIQNVITTLVHSDQVAYIKGRYIGNNARHLLDIFEYADNFDKNGAIICLDFQKAFDSLEWNFMFKTLKQYNFGDNMIRWISAMYKNPVSIIKNNGWMGKMINISRGIRQGCPASALLFILCTEVMNNMLRNSYDVKGFNVGTVEKKLFAYADDTELVVRDKESISHSLKIIESFGKVSGLKLNMTKCIGIWLGKYRDTNEKFEGIQFTNEPVKCLGIYIGHSHENQYLLNWSKKIEKLKNVLSVWKMRRLTVYGKVAILRSLALSSLQYNFNVLPVDSNLIKRINTIIYNFMWNKKERICRNTLIGKCEEGGINMPDVESMVQAAKAAWITRIYKDDNLSKVILNEYVCKYNLNINMLHKCCFVIKDELAPNILPDFYKEVFMAYYKCQYKKPVCEMSSYEYLTQILWGNNMFKHKGKCLLYSNWIHSKIIHVKDLYDDDGNFINGAVFYEKLNAKSNWITEYMTLKNVVHKITKRYKIDTTAGKYINIKEICKPVVVTRNSTVTIIDNKTKFFYEILVRNKFKRTYMEHVWKKELDTYIDCSYWEKIYKRVCCNIFDKKLCEFRYKLLHNLLCCNAKLHLWRIRSSDKCNDCEEKGTVKHMLLNCAEVNMLWKTIGKALNVNIQWKHLVIGFDDSVLVNRFRNIMISVIMYAIYMYFYQAERKSSLTWLVSGYLNHYYKVMKCMDNMEKYCKLYENLLM